MKLIIKIEKLKKIFGFGSLINEGSIRCTVPNAKNICPAFIKGYKRNFNLHDPTGFGKGEYKGVEMCALDVQQAEVHQRVNGVVFEMDDIHFDQLLEREKEYHLIEADAFCYNNHRLLGNVYFFSANKNNGSFNFENQADLMYLYLCLQGAKKFGDEYYKDFLETTFIGDENLNQVPEIHDIIIGKKVYDISDVIVE